jgi:hypothetical protein
MDEREELIERLRKAYNGSTHAYLLGELVLDVIRYLEGLNDD